MYFAKSPNWLKLFFPSLVWNIPKADKTIFLTFDDGPEPTVTPWVLSVLNEYNAKATFFCIGDNVRKHPETYEQILNNGHAVGNHTFNHLNGWKCNSKKFVKNVEECAHYVHSKLIRPPYGRIKPRQIRLLKQLNYKIIMWDVVSGDFDTNTMPDECLNNVIKHTENGSIVVFHDSIKASTNLYYTLPLFLKHFTVKGYKFDVITL